MKLFARMFFKLINRIPKGGMNMPIEKKIVMTVQATGSGSNVINRDCVD